MFHKSLISKLSWTIAIMYVIFVKHHIVAQLCLQVSWPVDRQNIRFQQKFDILRDIKPYNFEPPVNKVTDSINCEELAAASADIHLEQPSVPPLPGPDQELDWCVFDCVGIRA